MKSLKHGHEGEDWVLPGDEPRTWWHDPWDAWFTLMGRKRKKPHKKKSRASAPPPAPSEDGSRSLLPVARTVPRETKLRPGRVFALGAVLSALTALAVAYVNTHTPSMVTGAMPLVRVARLSTTLVTDGPPAPTPSPGQRVTERHCPADMVLVEGDWCTNVDQRCLRWIDEDTQMRCAEFAPPRCTGRRRHMALCMDRYEYPNQPGAHPMVMANWYEARRLCEAQHKRLCTQAEWTFACEGPDMNPYPYGLRRDADACRIDHQTMVPDRARLGNPMTSADESARLYEAVPSGSMPRCVSWAGVHDMTGNVDEWAINETGKPFNSALKGGWWGHIRARCRPATIAHNEGFVYYQIGFRCCGDPDPPYVPETARPARRTARRDTRPHSRTHTPSHHRTPRNARPRPRSRTRSPRH